MCHKHDCKPLTKFDPDKPLGYELCARCSCIARYLSIPLETLRSKSNAPSFSVGRLGSAVPHSIPSHSISRIDIVTIKFKLMKGTFVRANCFSTPFFSFCLSQFQSHIELRRIYSIFFAHAKVTRRVDSSSATFGYKQKNKTKFAKRD